MIKVHYKLTQENNIYEWDEYWKDEETYNRYISDCRKIEYELDRRFFYNQTEEEANNHYKGIPKDL